MHIPLADDCFNTGQQDSYWAMMTVRRVILAVSSMALLANITRIIIRKQYTYVTMKLLLFLQSAYLVSLVIVLLHWELFSNNVYSVSNLTECINKLMDRVVNEGVGIAPCAIEAFINLSFYNTSYIFAVLISFYVRKVYDNTHSNFMVRYWKKILALVLFQALLLAIPFAMSFFASNEYSVPYSFGPNGFYMPDGQYYLFYCGPVSLDTPNGIIEYLFNIPFFSIVLLVVHCRLLCLNHQSKKRYSNLSQLNTRQIFAIKSNSFSLIIFLVQFFNTLKWFFVEFLDFKELGWAITLIGINIIFDLLPLVIVVIYFLWERKSKKKAQISRLIQTDSLVTSDQLV